MKSTAAAMPSNASASNRRQPVRSVRSTANRPTNYYKQPFGFGRTATASTIGTDPRLAESPGFFPGLTFFSDAIAALPKEVMRYLTVLKETEGKAYPFEEAIAQLMGEIQQLPDPPPGPNQAQQQAFLSFSLNNSVNGSVNGSVVDGGASTMAPASQAEESLRAHAYDENFEKRMELFRELRVRLVGTIGTLDEKNMVLSNANETLRRQLNRLDSAMPTIENEISEEARLGSNKHWALPHMKEQRRANGAMTNERSRREVQAAHNLAAAATAVHEGDIAATRSEARREALLAKRKQHAPDSDFDERPVQRKNKEKGRKLIEAADAKIPDGAPAPKKRRVEKVAAPGMERSLSAAMHGRLEAGPPPVAPRDTTNGEVKRRKKQAPAQPAPRKKNNAESPSTAASPTRGTFSTVTSHNKEPSKLANGHRPRQPSISSIKPATANSNPPSRDRPGSSSLKNGAITQHTRPELPPPPPITARGLKREETEPAEDEQPAYGPITMATSRSRQGTSSRAPKPPTPNVAEPVSMARSRSNRGSNRAAGDTATLPAGPASPRAKTQAQKKNGSGTSTKAGTSTPKARSRATTPVAASRSRPTSSRAADTTAGLGISNAYMTSTSTLGSATKESEVARPSASPISSPAGSRAGTPAPRSKPPTSAATPPIGGLDGTGPAQSANPLLSASFDHPGMLVPSTADPTVPMIQHTPAIGLPPSAPPVPQRDPSPSTETEPAVDRDDGTSTPLRLNLRLPSRSPQKQSTAPLSSVPDDFNADGAERELLDDEPPVDPDVPVALHATAAALAAEPDGASLSVGEPEADDATNQSGPPSDADEDEPRYCVCGQVSYGEMVACDNDSCPREWFHLACVGLVRPPRKSEKWFCAECQEALGVDGRGNRKTGSR